MRLKWTLLVSISLLQRSRFGKDRKRIPSIGAESAFDDRANARKMTKGEGSHHHIDFEGGGNERKKECVSIRG